MGCTPKYITNPTKTATSHQPPAVWQVWRAVPPQFIGWETSPISGHNLGYVSINISMKFGHNSTFEDSGEIINNFGRHGDDDHLVKHDVRKLGVAQSHL